MNGRDWAQAKSTHSGPWLHLASADWALVLAASHFSFTADALTFMAFSALASFLFGALLAFPLTIRPKVDMCVDITNV